MTLLTVENLRRSFGSLVAVDGVSFEVEAGEIVGMIGPNGAGKTTTFDCVSSVVESDAGTVTFDGRDVTTSPPHALARRGLVRTFQRTRELSTMTVEENLRIGAYPLGGLPEDRLLAVVEQFPVLEERLDQRAGNLSGGQQQLLAMARALIPEPPLLLLDEPSAGLAPDLVDEMFDHIDAINDRGVTVLIVEQNAKTALRRCDRGYVLAQGENRYADEGETLLNDPEVRKQFLGG
ncbi:ABC transporter ATP-binding protein [Salinilacihabitans rarus]|uniref:ABC transporter ATP-binding protein n=1 Tax=Salinilacihabitans rarus TaxID=2961596 RepID=UPI0020C90B96|nr:ATP-binding cassette domain-containing protein [Salinilacihabitans rarus]